MNEINDYTPLADTTGNRPESVSYPQPFAEHHAFRDQVLALVGAIGVTGLVVVVSTATWFGKSTTPQEELAAVIAEAAVDEPLPVGPNPYESLALEAKAVIVYDLARDQALYSENGGLIHPLASLTKLMTGLIASETLENDKQIIVRQSALETEGDSGLFANETWNWRDLLSFTMISSSNDGAEALATVAGLRWTSTPEEASPDYEKVDAFVKRMNLRAHDIGLQDTFFRNATGLDEGVRREGAVGTARDMAQLVGYIWEFHPEVLLHTTEPMLEFRSTDGYPHAATNTNEYVQDIPGLLGSKTGFTDLAGGNLAIVYDSGLNHPIVIVVLGSSREGRFSDVDKLVRATSEYMRSGWYDYEVAGSTPKS